MKLKYLLVGLILFIDLGVFGHPLHLTFTNLEFKTQRLRWELTVKVFSDDFQSEPAMKTMIENQIKIWFDSKPVEYATWMFVRSKVKDDATWLTYSFTAPIPSSEIKIRNTLLMDQYSDQKNLFIIVMGKFQSAYEFKNKHEETTFKLNK